MSALSTTAYFAVGNGGSLARRVAGPAAGGALTTASSSASGGSSSHVGHRLMRDANMLLVIIVAALVFLATTAWIQLRRTPTPQRGGDPPRRRRVLDDRIGGERSGRRNGALLKPAPTRVSLHDASPHTDDDSGAAGVETTAPSTVPPVPSTEGGSIEKVLDEKRSEQHSAAIEQAAASNDDHGGSRSSMAVPLAADTPQAIELLVRARSYDNSIMLIPVNDGYLDFGLNLICSLQHMIKGDVVVTSGGVTKNNVRDVGAKTSADGDASSVVTRRHWGPLDVATRSVGHGFVFIAMDGVAKSKLESMRLPFIQDPDIPVVSSKSAQWADEKFHKLVCTKLIAVRRILGLNMTVILSDADIVFLADPTPYYAARTEIDDLDIIWSIGSCHRDLEDNYDLSAGDGIAKINTGFYMMKPSDATRRLVSRALDHCRNAQLTGDQPAINQVLSEDRSKGMFHGVATEADHGGDADHRLGAARDSNGGPPMKGHNDQKQKRSRHDHTQQYTYGFFDGCAFANGCIYFKHLCDNMTGVDPRSPRAERARLRRQYADRIRTKSSPLKAKGKGGARGDEPEEPLPRGLVDRAVPAMVHANFLVGKKTKIKHFAKYGMWDESCIAAWRRGVV